MDTFLFFLLLVVLSFVAMYFIRRHFAEKKNTNAKPKKPYQEIDAKHINDIDSIQAVIASGKKPSRDSLASLSDKQLVDLAERNGINTESVNHDRGLIIDLLEFKLSL